MGDRQQRYAYRMKLERQRRRRKYILILAAIVVVLGAVAGIGFASGWFGGGAPAPSPTPAPTVAPTAAPTAEPIATATPAPTQTPAMAKLIPQSEGAYTIAWFSDPQHYAAKFPATYAKQTQFLADESERLRLAYTVFTGDFINDNTKTEQWDVAVSAFKTISALPYGVLAGNHDISDVANDFTNYKKYFGDAAMKERSADACRTDVYEDNRGHVDLITAGSTSYAFVYMSDNPTSAGYAWVKSMFDKYPDRVGVLCLHDYFNTDGTLSDEGKKWQSEVVAKCKNVYMVLCGHRYTIKHSTVQFDDDGDGTKERTVCQMIMNYQTAGSEGGDGYMRFMQIDEAAGKIYVFSYSPLKEDYIYFDNEGASAENYACDPAEEEFTIDIPWSADAATPTPTGSAAPSPAPSATATPAAS